MTTRGLAHRGPTARAMIGCRHCFEPFFEQLEHRTLLAGVTIVTHGNAGYFGDPAFPVWVDQMRDDLAQRKSQDLMDNSGLPRAAVRTGWLRVTDEPSGLQFSASIPARSSLQNNGEIVLSLDWAHAAELFFGHSTDDVGAFIADRLLAPEYSWLLSLPMHFIGHSRGASLIAAIADHLGRAGVWVDHLTFLDAHPVALRSDYRDGQTVNTPDNVVFADSYFRADGLSSELTDVDGYAAGGSYAVELLEANLDESDGHLNGFKEEHADTHLWYRGTVKPFATIEHGDMTSPEGIRWGRLTEDMRADWYHEPAMQEGRRTGFYYSRSGAGMTQRPLSGLHNGMVFPGGRGSGSRDEIPPGSEVWPNVLDLGIRGSSALEAGDTLGFEYQYSDVPGSATVELYLDTDLNPFNDRGERFWTRTHGSTGERPSRTISAAAIPGHMRAGTYYLLARTTDGSRDRFMYAQGFVTVRGGSDGDWSAARATAVSGTANSDGWMVVATVNGGGDPLAFEENAEGDWSARNLRDLFGLPAATGNIEIWTDPLNGLTHASVTTGSGLLLFRRDAKGEWSYRNLNREIPGVGLIGGDITVFVGKNNHVHIAGLDSRGDLVLFEKSNDEHWTATNLAERDLVMQGQPMPQFTGPIISYVTAWNGLNIVGLDAHGDIRALWWAPGRQFWSSANLSTITGAPKLDSGLTAYVTDWGGVNIIGLDSGGSVLATWWVPSFGGDWKVSNLTAVVNGPPFDGSSVTSFVAPWGAINIAGLSSSGDVLAYWWTPGGVWQVANLTRAVGTNALPAGPVRGLTVRDPLSISVLTSAENGDVLRYWWKPEVDNFWHLENLSQLV